MKKIEAYIKAEKLKDTIGMLKKINAPGFTYYSVTGHGKEVEADLVPAGRITYRVVEDILPREKIEVVCDDADVEKIIDAIRGGCCTAKSGDGMVFISPINEAQRLRTKEKLTKPE